MAIEELQDLKGVWLELTKIWEKIEELREKPWLSVAPRKIRQELDQLLQQLKGFPARLKTYASYEYVVQLLKGYTKVEKILWLLQLQCSVCCLVRVGLRIFESMNIFCFCNCARDV